MKNTILQKYNTPSISDMLIIIPFFNPTQSIRITQNLLINYSKLINSNIPFHIIHCILPNDNPILPTNQHYSTIQSNSILFCKENIVCLTIKKFIDKYDKFMMLDSDVIFSSTNFYDKVSNLLNDYDVIHPFDKIYYLNINFQNISKPYYSYIDYILNKDKYDNINNHNKDIINSLQEQINKNNIKINNIQNIKKSSFIKSTNRKIIPINNTTIIKNIQNDNIKLQNDINNIQNKIIEFKQGFSFAFTKNLFLTNIIPEECVIGGGDVIFIKIFQNNINIWIPQIYHNILHTRKLQHNIKFTFLKNENIFHLYHNDIKNRQHTSRYNIIKKYLSPDINIYDIIHRNSQGLYQWNDDIRNDINKDVLQYFIDRQDDEYEIDNKIIYL